MRLSVLIKSENCGTDLEQRLMVGADESWLTSVGARMSNVVVLEECSEVVVVGM